MRPKNETAAPAETTRPEILRIDDADCGSPEGLPGSNLSRRTFVGSGVAALTLAYAAPRRAFPMTSTSDASVMAPSVFLSIDGSGRVTVTVHRSEMGQGVRTSLPMIVADELGVDLDTVHVEQALGDKKYGDQNTDGSKSIRLNLEPLRRTAASAREMLVRAAANRLKVSTDDLTVEDGTIRHASSGRSLTFGDVVADAAKIEVPDGPTLKDPSEFRYIGKGRVHYDVPDFVVGKGTFGIDVQMDGMLHASIERSPTLAGKVVSFDADAAKAVRGVKQVVQIEPNPGFYRMFGGVAVLATSTWAAMKGRKALEIEWDRGAASETSDAFRAQLDELIEGDGKPHREEGDYAAAKASADTVLSAKYHAPYLVHAPMEPLAATALVTDESCEIWAPSQDPQTARTRVAQLLGLDEANVTIHVTLLGGGFGRKSKPDWIFEAALLAKEVKGTPVKVTWTREDEVRHGYYRAQNAQRIEATMDAGGKVTGWRHHSAFPTIASTFAPMMSAPAGFELDMGMTNMPYRIPNIRLESSGIKSDLRIGWLRSVCNTFHAHAINCFVDELAEAAGKDPVAYRLEMLGEPRVVELGSRDQPYGQDIGRLKHVIEKCAELSKWGKAELADGVGHGFASHFSFLTYVAMAMQASVEDGKAKVHHVDCVMDCGTFVNRDTVHAQIEGSVAFALSYALHGKITTKDGAVVESNFHNYPLLRVDEMPTVNIHLVESTEPPAGVGEPGVPPVAPALANALHAVTGKRIRDLPLEGQDLS